MRLFKLATMLVVFLQCSLIVADDSTSATIPFSLSDNTFQLSDSTLNKYYNFDGSCVQCSLGMVGVWCNERKAAFLLWDSQYGPGIRGGSGPERVARYCDQRKIRAWNITGEQTYDYMRWACKTGRFAAIGADEKHFQTLCGIKEVADSNGKVATTWYVCNNQNPTVIKPYNDKQFRALHEASGEWCVILEKPSSRKPVLTGKLWQ